MNFAVIEAGGKQYKVRVGEKIKIEKISGKEGEIIRFNKVLLKFEDGKVSIGTPYLSDAEVQGKIISQGKDKKKIVFRYRSKTRYRKKKGHRQAYTEVEIANIK